ncbi:MAG: tellurite resistance TerB C-terminal domain-containing protein, partial [Promethearchaeota archaeon]
QIKVLRILIDNKIPKEEFDQLAVQTATLPEAIIESINEIALEIIDDIIIDSEQLTIIEEYIDSIKSIIKK